MKCSVYPPPSHQSLLNPDKYKQGNSLFMFDIRQLKLWFVFINIK